MFVERLWLEDFRNYRRAEVEFAEGLTVVTGANGQGKTNLVEALGVAATGGSIRGASTEVLVRRGADRAVVRAAGRRDRRELLVEAELPLAGRTRLLLNRQRVQRTRDLFDGFRITLFAPDDLILVKGGPAERRRFLDELLVSVTPRLDNLRSEVERVLRQRNALLRQSGGRLTSEIETTLEVWDAKLVETGERLAAARVDLLERLSPKLLTAYAAIAGRPTTVEATYVSSWREQGLAAALVSARADDLRRGASRVGPHRDEVELVLDGLPARTHASQGEQRTLALALRLAGHELVRESLGGAPVLLLDDIFSELDPHRSELLLASLPAGQTVVTTAGTVPPGSVPELSLRVEGGEISEVRRSSEPPRAEAAGGAGGR